MSTAHGWPREIFALSVAMQTLLYGAAQPFSGAIADRFGTVRVIIAGALLYAAGIYMMAQATTPGMLYLSSGVLIGFGLSGCSFNLVISSFGKLLPESWRSLAFGAGTASGSFGQFLFSPLGVYLIDAFGWQAAIEIFAGLLLLIVPLAIAIATPRSDAPAPARHGAERGAEPDLPAGLGRGLRPPLLHPAGARLLHLRLPARLRHPAPARLPDGPRPLRRDRRLDLGRDRALQHRRRDAVRLARRLPAEALHPVVHLFRPRADGGLPHHVAGKPGGDADLRRGHRAALALDRCRRPRAWSR